MTTYQQADKKDSPLLKNLIPESSLIQNTSSFRK